MPPIPQKTTTEVSLDQRVKRLAKLLDLLEPVPDEWLSGRKLSASGETTDACTPCKTWNELVQSWRKAMKWHEGLDRALSVMLASVLSTKVLGEQLWIKVIGPPSCGKSTLCEALSINTNYVKAVSTLRGFHSGYRETSDKEEDNSLLQEANGKTLVIKDGDTLMQAPNLTQILSEGRDIYDTTSRTHYRNKASKAYEGVRMTWILCGTASLRALDKSELGARFLDCVIMERIEDEMEDEILMRAAHRAERGVSVEADENIENRVEPEMAEAMRLTGGYIDHLRQNAPELLSQVSMPIEQLRYCTRLAKFVAFIRARPSSYQDEDEEREFAPRLVVQHVRLAKCMAVVLNQNEVNEEVLRRVKQVAMDTGRGITLKIADQLFKHQGGLDVRSIAIYVNRSEDQIRRIMRFLRHIRMAQLWQPPAERKGGRVPPKRWRLSPYFRHLYMDAKEISDAPDEQPAPSESAPSEG